MLKKIIHHETLLNLVSFRFYLIISLFAVMFFGGLYVSTNNYKTRLGEYTEIMAKGDSAHIAIPPNSLGAFSEGMDQFSAMAAVMENAQYGMLPVKTLGKSGVSVRLSAFETLDFSFAIKVLLSLGAILVTFATVSGERFTGTLKLASASGLSKRHLILAKLSASFLCLAAPLIICTAIACIFLAINNMATAAADIARIALFTAFSLIYIIFFVLVGLIISISTRRPQESLAAGVLAWLMLVFVVPALIPPVAHLFSDLPSARGMEEARSRRLAGTIFEQENSSDKSASLGTRFEHMRAINDSEWEVARNQLTNYAKTKRRLDLLSPADIYESSGMEIVGNGIQNALHAKNSILQHKTNIQKSPDSKFSFQRLSFLSDFMSALASILILCLETCLLLTYAYRKFMRLDQREG